MVLTRLPAVVPLVVLAAGAAAALGAGLAPSYGEPSTRSDAAVGAGCEEPAPRFGASGRRYLREPLRYGPWSTPMAAPRTSVAAATDVLDLSSRPGAARTIYLDFTGHRTGGTAWNRYFGVTPFTSPPYQVDGSTSTAFTATEREQIRRAWERVAQDYAPFAVDVTTRHPGRAALTRGSRTDRRFGTRVVVTAGGPLYDRCSCGGITHRHADGGAGAVSAGHRPTFVFTHGTGPGGWHLAEAASHLAGHELGLPH